MHDTPEPLTVRAALLNRLSAYCGPWTPVALADLFMAMAMELGLIPSSDIAHLAPIAEGHIPLMVMAVVKTLRSSEVRTTNHVEMATAVLDALRVFHTDYRNASAQAVGLTLRQRQALTGVANGRTYREIGEELDLEYTTVSTHLENARKALGARNSTEAVVKALRMGLIDPDAVCELAAA